ncbi:amidohydrolase [Bradyrhizobiaceae bacterium SG-6C]|nr:amidohydrolase [Bradyrhizobiaceae bacterium SG-6C]
MHLLVIENADWLVTMDADRRLIKNGTIVVEDDRIVAVGKASQDTPYRTPDKVIDARGKVVFPGLIDSHIHHSLQLGRGLADETNPIRFLYDRMYPLESNLSEEDAYIGALLCQLDCIRAGTTCVIDAGNYFPDATLRAFATSGMRGVVARSAFDIPGSTLGTLPGKTFNETTEVALARCEEFISRTQGACDGRVRSWLQLRVLPNCSDELCIGLKKLTDRLGVQYQAHAAFCKEVYEASETQFGKSEIRRLHDLGLLGPNLLLAHVGWLTPPDMRLLIESRTNVVLCPTSSLHHALGSILFGHIPELIEMGVNVSLGTDGGPHGTNDMVRQMFVTAGGYKEARLNAKVMPPETVLEMATIGGAKAANWQNEIGSLETGKKADITIFDAARPEWRPLHNPAASITYFANGNTAHTVLVNGRILMEAGRITFVDEQQVLEEAQKRAVAVAQRGGVLHFGRPVWPVI